MRYLIGTRGSKLALVQTNLVIEKLTQAYPKDEFLPVVIKTTGDIVKNRQLDQIGSKGIFVKEIEEELLEGKIQMAVHSLKDMPEEPAEGLTFAKAWLREDSRDVLILKNVASIDDLPKGSVIGTGSKRRKYQLLQKRPDLRIVGIRGNIDTRLRKLYGGEAIFDESSQEEVTLDGIVIAGEVTQYLSVDDMIPAPAQGTLALEVRADNLELLTKLDALSDEKTDLCVQAERGFLKRIGGDCHTPVAAFCDVNASGKLELRAMYGTEDGSKLASTKVSEADVAGCVSEKEKTAKMVEVAAQKICEELGELRFS